MLLALLLGMASATLAAQAPASDRRSQMQAVLSSIDASRPATAADAERMLALLDKAEVADLSASDRRAAITELYREVWRFRGFDVNAEEAAIGRAAGFAAGMFGFGARFSLEMYAPAPGAQDGRIHVVRRGRGPVPLVLVSDLTMPAEEIYGGFMARHADRYTMYAVTLPGFGAAGALSRPGVLDYSRVPWLDATERQIAELITSENLSDVVVVGTAVGGYFSAALAARHPDRIRAAVVVNGLVHFPLRSPDDPNRTASEAERVDLARRALPIELAPAFWPPADRDQFRALLADPPPTTGWVDFMAFAARDGERTLRWTLEHFTPAHVWRQARFTAELAATDLTPDLLTLKRPILVIASTHDHLSPGIGVPVEAQWTELQLRAPDAPVTIVTLGDVRAYPTVDAPGRFDETLTAFLERRPVTSTRDRAPAALASPFATTSLYVGASDVRIAYFRPAVRAREIWGALVPYERLWRTGANEAPRITFSHDVTIEGEPLAAGTYTLLTIPGPREWTLIFNRIPGQFGTFAYDPAFDALRVEVASEPAAIREWFEIAAEPTGPSEAVLTLRWDRLAVPFRVALATP